MGTGTFVTVAASTHRYGAECRGRIHLLDVRRRGHRADHVLVRRRPLHAAARASGCSRTRRCRSGGARPDHARVPPLPLLAMRARWITILLTLVLSVPPCTARTSSPGNSSPPSDRPELLVDLTLPETASIHGTREVAARVRRAAHPRPRHRPSEHLCRPRRCAVLPAAEGAIAERFLRPSGDRGQGPGAARPCAERDSRRRCDGLPEVAARVYPLEMGPPVGWPVQYRVSGPEPNEVREIAHQLA